MALDLTLRAWSATVGAAATKGAVLPPALLRRKLAEVRARSCCSMHYFPWLGLTALATFSFRDCSARFVYIVFQCSRRASVPKGSRIQPMDSTDSNNDLCMVEKEIMAPVHPRVEIYHPVAGMCTLLVDCIFSDSSAILFPLLGLGRLGRKSCGTCSASLTHLATAASIRRSSAGCCPGCTSPCLSPKSRPCSTRWTGGVSLGTALSACTRTNCFRPLVPVAFCPSTKPRNTSSETMRHRRTPPAFAPMRKHQEPTP